eukprot:gene28986-32468_t
MFPDGTILAASPSGRRMKASTPSSRSNNGGNDMKKCLEGDIWSDTGQMDYEADMLLRRSDLMNVGKLDQLGAESLSASSQSAISDFKAALQQLNSSNSRASTAATARGATASEEEKRSSQFDVEGILRKNRRKLGVLSRAALQDTGGQFRPASGLSARSGGDADMETIIE